MAEVIEQVEESTTSTLDKLDPTELVSIIKDTRSEAKKYRLELKAIKDQLSGFESAKEQAEQDKKIAEGKKDEVIQELSGKLSSTQKKAEEWDNYQASKREALKGKIGDNWLESFVNLPLIDLEKLADKFNGSTTLVDTDNGQGKKLGQREAILKGLENDLALARKNGKLVDELLIQEKIKEAQG